MSAFIVGSDHIDYLVTAAIQYNIPMRALRYADEWLEAGNADAVGARLWQENIASVMLRYSHCDDMHAPDPDTYRYRRFGDDHGDTSSVAVFKAIACYEYQSCEHPGWKDSEAARFCDRLRHVAITRLQGYDRAAWEVTREETRTR